MVIGVLCVCQLCCSGVTITRQQIDFSVFLGSGFWFVFFFFLRKLVLALERGYCMLSDKRATNQGHLAEELNSWPRLQETANSWWRPKATMQKQTKTTKQNWGSIWKPCHAELKWDSLSVFSLPENSKPVCFINTIFRFKDQWPEPFIFEFNLTSPEASFLATIWRWLC